MMGAYDRMELLASARMLIAERKANGVTPLAQLSLEDAVELVERLERAGHEFAPMLEVLTAAIADRMAPGVYAAVAAAGEAFAQAADPVADPSRMNAAEAFAAHRRYIGMKAVAAWPETKDGREGYGVCYRDGYRSWSPRATFEESYKLLDELLPA